MKILVTAIFSQEYIEKLKEKVEVIYEPWFDADGKLQIKQADDLVNYLNNNKIDIFICEPEVLRKDVLEKLQTLKLIVCAKGTEFFIDTEIATQKNIIVAYTPGRNANSVAEYTIGLILAITRGIVNNHNRVRNRDWPILSAFSDRGIELNRKTAGIIGLGAIGYRIGTILKTFGMKIIVYDPYVKEDRLKSLEAKQVDLDTLMKESDIVTVHALLTEETKGLISKEKLSLMKPSAYFINTSRGKIVDEDALTELLEQKRLRGAALDVFVREPIKRKSKLLDLDNVITTSHIGGSSADVPYYSSKMAYEEVLQYLDGKPPHNCLNPDVLKKNLRIENKNL
ncbi:MAG TPA: NAD(P)-dependent oxidoreductase [Candidatus Deferrimicrobium sp.]|nr:NAD(P)-dependent oxidoreductase [Candidatus Deferrimicrobium sp.]